MDNLSKPIPKPAPKKKKKRPGFHSPASKWCEECGRTDIRIERHHRKLRSQGGTDEEANKISLCLVCHGKAHGLKVKI